MSDELLARLAALEGLVAEATGLRLLALAQTIPADKAIVELGSFKGKSTCYIASGAQMGLGAPVYAVDAWDMPQNIKGKHDFTAPSVREKFYDQTDSLGLSQSIIAMQGLSAEVGKAFRGSVGMLFIDASHEYEDVRDDFRAWLPHLVIGAVVVFDDYGRRNPGVRRFVDELRKRSVLIGWDFDTPPLAIAWKRS